MFGANARSQRLVAQMQAFLDDSIEAGIFPAGWLLGPSCLEKLTTRKAVCGSMFLGLPILAGKPQCERDYELVCSGDPRLSRF